MQIKTKEDRRQRIKYRIRKRMRGTLGAAAPVGVPQRVAHLRAGDRRHGGHDGGVGVERRAGRQGARWTSDTRAGNRKGAELVGQTIAERLKEKGITRVIFDRNGFLYHGRVRAVADAARRRPVLEF